MDDILTRALQNLFGRMNAPMALRLVIQPVMAAIFATRDGIKDARLNQPPYGWSILTESGHQRGHRLLSGTFHF